jgi:hypothetical protein
LEFRALQGPGWYVFGGWFAGEDVFYLAAVARCPVLSSLFAEVCHPRRRSSCTLLFAIALPRRVLSKLLYLFWSGSIFLRFLNWGLRVFVDDMCVGFLVCKAATVTTRKPSFLTTAI